jgi:hypothetical protein
MNSGGRIPSRCLPSPPLPSLHNSPPPIAQAPSQPREVGAGYVILIQRSFHYHCQRQSKVELSLCLTNLTLRHEDVWGSGCIDPGFLDLGTIWRSVVSFTPRPLYPCGKSPRYPLDRRLGGPQNWSELCGEEKILATPGLELWPLGRPARGQSLIPTTLSRLLSSS